MSDSDQIWQRAALAVTIEEAFSQALPALNQKAGLGANASTSSESTLKKTLPILWLDRKKSHYTEPADTALGEKGVRKVTVQNCMPGLEGTHKIQCEPDLVRPAALYFLHPVHMALKAKYPGVSIICRSEPYEDRSFRPDIIYEKNGRTFAILEYKVPGVVEPLEFNEGRTKWESSKEQIAAKKQAAADRGGEITFFGDRAKILMKQLGKYVEKTETTKYAALFNWDYLFLTVYDRLDTELIYGTLIPRNTTDLRKAYLGWLIEAFDNDGECRLDPPGGRPAPNSHSGPQSGDGGSGSGNGGSDSGNGGSGSGHGGSGGTSGGGSGGGSGRGTGSGGKGSDDNTRVLRTRNEHGVVDNKNKQAAVHPGRAAPHSGKAAAAPTPGKTAPAHSMRSSTPTNGRPAQPTNTGAPTTAGLPHRQAPGNHGSQAQQTQYKQQQGQQPVSASKQQQQQQHQQHQQHQQSKPAHPPAQTHGQQPTGQAPRANAAPAAQQKTRLTTNAAPAQQRAPGRVARTEQGAGSQRR